MKRRAFILVLSLGAGSDLMLAGQGPASATGACSHVLGPIDGSGNPLGFTCTDVGGSALLVWNAAQLNSNISVTGQIKTVNFYSGDFSVAGTFKSDGDIAFVGGSITVTGSIIGSGVLIAGVTTNDSELKSTLLGPAPSRLTSNSLLPVIIDTHGKVEAKSGNVVVVGQNIQNFGGLTARNGSVMLKTGTKVDIGWGDSTWIEGKQNISNDLTIVNTGTITAYKVEIEAQRIAGNYSIQNSGTIIATDSTTFVTGAPGIANPDGTYKPSSFGIANNKPGKLFAPKIVVSQYYKADPGGLPKERVFDTTLSGYQTQLKSDLGTGVFGPTQDNTPTSTTSAVIDSTRTSASTLTTTSNIVVPQLAPSMTHLNATSQVMKPTLVASNGASEQVRGTSTQPVTAKPKSRVKAKPVLVRGAFFDSKISATITPNP